MENISLWWSPGNGDPCILTTKGLAQLYSWHWSTPIFSSLQLIQDHMGGTVMVEYFLGVHLGNVSHRVLFTFPTADHFEHIGEVPYVAVRDEAFPLMPNLLRPFPGKGNHGTTTALSRARRIVENAFVILAARWWVFHTKMQCRRKTLTPLLKLLVYYSRGYADWMQWTLQPVW